MPIRVLPQTLINQIAAGEVVVNMASVIKELVENAIDAGSSRIDVEIANEVRDVTVADDGCGMNRDDAELCLQRHATSKISSPDDLFNLVTRGFRGEAIPSIASVSRVEIQSRPHDDLSGTRIVVEGGAIENIGSAGCPAGTRIAVRDLFFNTPARRKFLKSTTAEMNAIMQTVVRQALAVPHIGFRIVRDGQPVLELPPKQSGADRFLAIAGSRITSDLLEVAFEREGAAVTGYLAQPQSSRGDRRSQYLFVNGRPFSSKPISSAIEQACRGFIMTGRFPIFCVFIEVPAGEVDINVHPTKEEVRFRNERNVAGACYHAARLALENHGYVPDMKLATEGDESGAASPISSQTPSAEHEQRAFPGFFAPQSAVSPMELVNRAFTRKHSQTDWTLDADRRQQFQPNAPEFSPAVDAPTTQPVESNPGNAERPDTGFWSQPYEPEVLGQVALKYILARFGEDLLIIDQHAAHERLRFLELMDRRVEEAPQGLLVPITFDVAADRTEALRALSPALEEMGFAIDHFGGRTWQITAAPGDLCDADLAAVMTDLLDEFEDDPKVNRVEDFRQRVLIRAACHSSIRAGRHLNQAEMEELLRLMRRHQLSFTCPHGRPTIVRLSCNELDKYFKRE